MLVCNTVALVLLIGNCWWESVAACYVALLLPLSFQVLHAYRDAGPLRRGLLFGVLVAAVWPIGEWFIVNVFGWWGEYVGAGPRVLETAVYCMLIGWLASTYCYYVGERTMDLGYSVRAACLVAGGSALGLGIVGENLFVAARMWTYVPSAWEWGAVPAFLPVSYGIGYATVPLFRRSGVLPTTIAFASVLFSVSIALGLLTGFLPRP